jgi:hypothetical protein
MTTLRMEIVEKHPSGRLVFNVRVQTDTDNLEFPISIEEKGTQAKNEHAVLNSVVELAETVAATSRRRLAS